MKIEGDSKVALEKSSCPTWSYIWFWIRSLIRSLIQSSLIRNMQLSCSANFLQYISFFSFHVPIDSSHSPHLTPFLHPINSTTSWHELIVCLYSSNTSCKTCSFTVNGLCFAFFLFWHDFLKVQQDIMNIATTKRGWGIK